jgi:hypothetical protein
MDFIVTNSEDVFASNSFQYLKESNSLLCEVMLALSKKFGGKRKMNAFVF